MQISIERFGGRVTGRVPFEIVAAEQIVYWERQFELRKQCLVVYDHFLVRENVAKDAYSQFHRRKPA